ncbi:hypothetical protein R3P38DRAFT_2377159, partial [Favolaschia claudopus]
MAPKGWARGRRLTWLESRLPEYLRKKAEGKLHQFWPRAYEDFFKEFPEQAELGLPCPTEINARQLTAEEEDGLSRALEKRKRQLDNWFHNSRKKTGDSVDATSAKTLSVILRLLQLQSAKVKRPHRPLEIFQMRNRDLVKKALTEAGYDSLLAQNVPDEEDDWTDESEDTPEARSKAKKSELMRLRTRVVAGLWVEASEEERLAVNEAVEEEKKQFKEAKDKGEEAETDVWGIDSIETAMVHVHKALYAATNWVGITLLGGPHPRLKGQLSLKVICHGKTPMGNDFEDVCMDFDDRVLKPFQDFLRMVYSSQSEESPSGEADAATAEPSTAEPTVRRIHAPPEPVPAAATAVKTKKPKKKKKTAPKSSPTVNDDDVGSSEQP